MSTLAINHRRAALAALATIVAFGIGLPIFTGAVTWPVQSVRISGELAQASKADFERTVEPLLAPGLLRIDVEALRRAALAIAWVREVTVRRVWPDGLDISVIERRAVARWASGGYLEHDGSHFSPGSGVGLDSLPVLAGPRGMQRRVLELHTTLQRVLAPLGIPLVATELTPRGVLHATLHGGPRLVMRPETVERDAGLYVRTIAHAMADHLHEIDRIDFRYPNGFAVRARISVTGSEEQ